MKRTRSGKRIEITARDLEIFRQLHRYRYLRSTYLHAFSGGASVTRLKERLGDLFHEGYLDRPEQQWQFSDGRYAPAVYEMGRLGRQLAGGVDTPCTWLSQQPRQYLHALMTCEILASIEIAMRVDPVLRFIPWGEIRDRAPQQGSGLFRGELRPDAVFGIEYRGANRQRYRFFALEVDRGTMPICRRRAGQSSITGKIATYRSAFDREWNRSVLGVPNLLLLVVTLTRSRAETISSFVAQPCPSGLPILVRGLASEGELRHPHSSFLTAPWDRPGHAPFHIGEPV
jgi:hypothetical protein